MLNNLPLDLPIPTFQQPLGNEKLEPLPSLDELLIKTEGLDYDLDSQSESKPKTKKDNKKLSVESYMKNKLGQKQLSKRSSTFRSEKELHELIDESEKLQGDELVTELRDEMRDFSITCSVCGLIFLDMKSKMAHNEHKRKSHSFVNFKNKTVVCRQILKARRRYLRIVTRTYNCNTCHRQFSWQNSLVIHKKTMHGPRKFSLENEEAFNKIRDSKIDFDSTPDVPVPTK